MKRTKKLLLVIFSMSILLAAFTANASAVSSSYDSDWRYWSQGGTGIGKNMQNYGCYIVSQAKLLVESGIIDSNQTFNPDTYANWGLETGNIQKNWTSSAYTAPNYAKALNKTLNYCGTKDLSKMTRAQQSANIMEWLNDEYYVILAYSKPSSHFYYVLRNDSINSGEIWLSDTQSSVANSTTAWQENQKWNPGHYLVVRLAEWRTKNGEETRNAQRAYLFSRTKTTLPASSNAGANASTTITVTTGSATEIAENSVRLNGTLVVTNGIGHITKHGMYLGTDPAKMTIIAEDKVDYYKNSLSMFYRTTKYGPILEAGTLYYYQVYAVVDGAQHTGEVRSFLTPVSATVKDSPSVSPEISLDNTSLTMTDTFSVKLTATTVPSGQPVIWQSSDPSVITVDGGVLTKAGTGTATITASMVYEGKTYHTDCEVTVNVPECKNHTKGTFLYSGTEHPHYNFYSCGNCGTTFTDNSTATNSGCPLCIDRSVITNPASDITATSAQLNGSLQTSATTSITEHGVYIGTSRYNMHLAARDIVNYTKSSLAMYYNTGKYGVNLEPETTYYYYCYAVINGETVRGDVVSFTTLALPSGGQGPSSTYYVHGTNGALAINSRPSSGYQIGRIPEGEACTVYLNKASGKRYWVEYNGISGYAYGDYLVLTKPITSDTDSYTPNVKNGIISGTNGALAINSRPSSGYQIGRIPEGESCMVYPDKASGNWYWVEYNGVSGYAYSKYIIVR